MIVTNRKMAYIARAAVPSPSTNSIHVAKISEAFVQQGENVLLIVSGGDEALDIKEYYGLRDDFSVKRIGALGKDRLAQLKWARRAVKEAKNFGADLIVTRDPLTALFSVLGKMETVLDLHGDLAHLCGRFYRMIRWKWFVDNSRFHPVFISKGLQDYYQRKYGLSPAKSSVLPDGCNLDDFTEASKRELILSKEELHLGYFGKALVGKGIDLIRRLALLDKEDIFDIYGAEKADAEKETGASFPENVVFHGHIVNKEVPEVMCNMDILLLPNQEKLDCEGEDIGKFTSPLKMFEYMASGRVVIASDLPVLREVIDESNAYLADSNDENAWYEAIKAIRSDGEMARKKALKAQSDVENYTWYNRAGSMLKLAKRI
jgi:glycosyltransferase involved in cell wall biosynthesis